MAISTIRKLTEEDWSRMAAAARRIIARHPETIAQATTEYPVHSAATYVEQLATAADGTVIESLMGLLYEDYGDGAGQAMAKALLRHMWKSAFRRAVRHRTADTYGWGYIGYAIDD